MTDHAIDLVLKMKASGLHVGALQRIFTGMQLMCGNKEMLPDLIDMAHEEIAVMLGLAWLGVDALRIYGCDEGGWFYQD